MKTYQNEHVRVEVDCSIHLLQQTWSGLPSSENFRDGSLAIMALAKRHQVNRWLVDLRQLRLFNPVDLHWFIQHWLPQATAEHTMPQHARVAVILNDLNQFGKLGSDLLLRASGNQNGSMASRYFVGNEDAREWLLRKS
ncbi:hypothetical protein EXU85_14825 [Spirosoma sp. KCTC 42546]|uniref:hypothetical protein n=1 Tax=Spirosoma sp. KCTC 42546 TaxID=2520506 RepID=UPI00115925A6|nr:hypothetical protein [Spirosoma sp. KCTC 42546]QDK79815.1 hypothetical protein EXU85_14825 [Spirosoma sp. KCTC 42546]